jgi:hypothetical protein
VANDHVDSLDLAVAETRRPRRLDVIDRTIMKMKFKVISAPA